MRPSSFVLRLSRLPGQLLYRLLPDLPSYERGGGPVIPQAIVVRQGLGGQEVLLVKRTTPRAWELPGGYAEPDEPPEAAMLREVREETGMTVAVERLVGWYRRTGFRPHRSPVYLCRPVSGAPQHSREAVAIAFFPVDRLPLGLFPWYRVAIRDAIAGVTFAAEREQRLGMAMVAASVAIHLGEAAGLLE